MQPFPEELLGKTVVGPSGNVLGRVVDVGLLNWRHAKFLLVERGSGPLLRVDLREVEDAEAPALRLTVPVNPDAAPA